QARTTSMSQGCRKCGAGINTGPRLDRMALVGTCSPRAIGSFRSARGSPRWSTLDRPRRHQHRKRQRLEGGKSLILSLVSHLVRLVMVCIACPFQGQVEAVMILSQNWLEWAYC